MPIPLDKLKTPENFSRVLVWFRDLGHNGYKIGRSRSDHIRFISEKTSVNWDDTAIIYDFLKDNGFLEILVLPIGYTQFFIKGIE